MHDSINSVLTPFDATYCVLFAWTRMKQHVTVCCVLPNTNHQRPGACASQEFSSMRRGGGQSLAELESKEVNNCCKEWPTIVARNDYVYRLVCLGSFSAQYDLPLSKMPALFMSSILYILLLQS